MYVTSHFRYRQALLCVSAEHKLMAEVRNLFSNNILADTNGCGMPAQLRLLPGKSKDDSAKQTKSIQSLLPYLSMEDLRDSGLLVHVSGIVMFFTTDILTVAFYLYIA